MTPADTRTLVIERELLHPPEKIWRALTEGALMKQWLLDNDFMPVVGRPFQFRREPMPQWDGVIDCKVLVVEPGKTLSYTWCALGLQSVVTWTLTASERGTLLRMEHSGFRPDQDAAFKGANYGWQDFIGRLERVVDGMEPQSTEDPIMSSSIKRSILRWIHLVLSIPIIGYIYGDPAEVQQYAGGVRYLFFPAIVVTGLWMWKGHVLRRVLSKKPA